MEKSRNIIRRFHYGIRKLYAQMVEAAEQAIAAIERADYGQAKQILISAEQRCEAEYLEMEETPRA